MNDQMRSWRPTLEDTGELDRDLANFIQVRRSAGGVTKVNKVSFPRNNWADTGAESGGNRADTPAARKERILGLQQEIAAGRYRVSAADLVDRMMTFMLRDV